MTPQANPSSALEPEEGQGKRGPRRRTRLILQSVSPPSYAVLIFTHNETLNPQAMPPLPPLPVRGVGVASVKGKEVAKGTGEVQSGKDNEDDDVCDLSYTDANDLSALYIIQQASIFHVPKNILTRNFNQGMGAGHTRKLLHHCCPIGEL